MAKWLAAECRILFIKCIMYSYNCAEKDAEELNQTPSQTPAGDRLLSLHGVKSIIFHQIRNPYPLEYRPVSPKNRH